jgi:uncharacterized protein (TIRG00374 family)
VTCEDGPVAHTDHAARRRAIRITLQIIVVALAVYLVWPLIGGFEETGRALARGSLIVLGGLVLLEAASLASYAELVRTVLRSTGERPEVWLVQRTTIVGTSLGRTLPGGTTTALAVVVGAMRRAGIDPARATAALAAAGTLSSFVLALLLPLAAATAIIAGDGGTVVIGTCAAAVAMLVVAVVLVPSVRHPEAAGAVVERVLRRVVPDRFQARLDPAQVRAAVERGVGGLRDLTRDRRALLGAMVWAALNWLLDAAVLFGCAMTVGAGTPLAVIPIAYVIGQLAMAVPLTPGGVGVVETAMIGALVAAGAPVAPATVAVLGYRLLSHWLPILVGLALMPTLPHR